MWQTIAAFIGSVFFILPITWASASELSPFTEITFSTPKRFAVISQPQWNVRRLYTIGDFIPDSRFTGQGVTVEQLLVNKMQIRNAHQKLIWVITGENIPESDGRQFEKTILLDRIQYRYVAKTKSPDPEARLTEVRFNRALLELDTIPPGPQKVAVDNLNAILQPVADSEPILELQKRLDKDVFEKVKVKSTGKNAYEVNSADTKTVIDHAGDVLTSAWPTIQPIISENQELDYRIRSDVIEGVLGSQGFRVDDPKLAQRAGLETGDIIQSVNGTPINGFTDLLKIYQKMKNDPNTTMVQISIQHYGQPVTKTYRLR